MERRKHPERVGATKEAMQRPPSWEDFAPPWEKFDKARNKTPMKDLTVAELKQTAVVAPLQVGRPIVSLVSISLSQISLSGSPLPRYSSFVDVSCTISYIIRNIVNCEKNDADLIRTTDRVMKKKQ